VLAAAAVPLTPISHKVLVPPKAVLVGNVTIAVGKRLPNFLIKLKGNRIQTNEISTELVYSVETLNLIIQLAA
jgi:hypothetical protein